MWTSWLTLGRDLGRGVLQILYPGICHACRRPTPPDQFPFCAPCLAALTTDPFSACPRCAGSIGPHALISQGCSRCRNEAYHFDSAFRMGPYDGLLRELILRAKHSNGEGTAEVLAGVWAEVVGRKLSSLNAEVVVPVALHWRRHWSRGFNQSEILGRALAKFLRLSCKSRWLRRIRNTPRQTQQTPSGRRDNVRGAFAASPRADLRGKTVVLVDDILTTGSTCSEAARALRQVGARQVHVVVLAHSQS